jgi:hypothetical protein
MFVLAGLVGLVLGVACELVVGLEELSNHKCGADEKRCGDECVSRQDPATGCSGLSCAPCTLPHATAKCGNNLECAIFACNEGYDNCSDEEPGCETDLAHDPKHCGGCDNEPCQTAHGTPGCSAGMCATGGCHPGWWDCNRAWQDGCETDLTTNTNCGACGRVCAAGTTCADGGCQ